MRSCLRDRTIGAYYYLYVDPYLYGRLYLYCVGGNCFLAMATSTARASAMSGYTYCIGRSSY